MIVLKPTLVEARTDVLLSQRDLAKLAGVGMTTIFRCESGEAIQLLTAKRILVALNERRQASCLPAFTVNDLDWKIR